MDKEYLDIIAGSGGGCFLEDTKVLTPSGLKNIIDIKIGEEVISFDDKGNLHSAKVLSTNSHTNKEVYRYNLWGGGYLDATPNHWVLNADNSFIEIGKADESISLVNASGFLTPIVSKELLGVFTVYNLIVDTFHTYIANGIRVHNGGGGKGGSAHIPSEAPDTLHSKTYAKVLDLICEGEIEGLVDGARSVYFNGTPLMNGDGSFNYKDVIWEARNGTQDQAVIEGFDEVEAEMQDGREVTINVSPTISITDPTVDKVRLAIAIPSLYQQESDGDLVGSEVSYQVLMQKNGSVGSGATAVVNALKNGMILSAVLSNGGSGYPTSGTTISISGTGTGAAITPTVENGVIKSVTIQSNGYYSFGTAPMVKVYGSGSGAELQAIVGYYSEGDNNYAGVLEIKVIKGGSGYTIGSTTIVVESQYPYNNDGGCEATPVVANGVITRLTVTNTGEGYGTGTTFTALGGGTGASITFPSIGSGGIKTIAVTNPGVDYVTPVITITDIALKGGNGASATATVSAGQIQSIQVTSPGVGYTLGSIAVTISSSSFTPITLTDTSAIVNYSDSMALAGGTYYRSVYGTFTSTKGIIALFNPYVYNQWYNGVYYFMYRYSYESQNCKYTLQVYDRNTGAPLYSYWKSGSLLYGQLNSYFRLEEVYKAYNAVKASNPTITLTYEQYIRNRLEALSPGAPSGIKNQITQLAIKHGSIFPVPFATYDIPNMDNKDYYIRIATSGYDKDYYTIASTSVGLFQVSAYYSTVINTIKGKTTSKYLVNHTVALPRTSEEDRFDLRIIRLTPDSQLSSLQNKLFFESYATIVSTKLRYPNSALFGIQINSENFTSIPTRGYHLKLLKIKIPDNYDPITGLYNRSNATIPAATNLFTYSQDLSSATWNKRAGIVASYNNVYAPDGTATADTIEKGSSTDGYIWQNITLSPNTTYTISVYAFGPSLGGPGTISFNAWDGSTAFVKNNVALTTEWARYSFTFTTDGTTSAGDVGIKVPGTAFLWGFQLEVGSKATGYIRTEYYTVTRPAAAAGTPVYDPITRQPIEQLWAGGFYTAWSNNPAWCFYDLITNDRYGLGEYIQPEVIDEYTLYSIGKYCDERVPDGFGGLERRFTLNAYIQTKQEAVKLLQDMASVFRGMIYWSSGLITAVQDAEGSTPVYQFNNSNVIEGTFNYSGASRKVIHNAALVSWNDPALLFKQRVEYVEDREAIDTYGYNPIEVVAFGCTSRGQAHRTGKALLYTEKVENNLVGFKAALDAAYLRPGLLVKIQDDTRSGTLAGGTIAGGRVLSISGNNITLDRSIPINSAGFRIRLNTINLSADIDKGYTDLFKTIEYTISQTSGTISTVTTVETITDTVISANTVWTVLPPGESEELYRILAVKETDEVGIYEIAGMLHNPSKYDYIENNLELQQYSYSTLDNIPLAVTFATPTANPDYPNTSSRPYITAPLMDDIYITGSGILNTFLNISFNRALYAVKYDVYLQKDSDDWVSIIKDGTTTSYTAYGVKDGSKYRVKVVAKNFTNKQSAPAFYPPLNEPGYTVLGKLRPPSNVTGFNVVVPSAKDSIDLSWNNITDLDLNTYEIKIGPSGSTWDSGSTTIQSIKATSVKLPPIVTGNYTYFIKAKDYSDIYSATAAEDTLNVLTPSTPISVNTTIEGTNLIVTWSNCEQTFAIKNYYVYLNDTVTPALTIAGNITKAAIPVTWSGIVDIYIKAEDVAGNSSVLSTVYQVNLTAPTINSATSRAVVDSNYVVDLSITSGALPILHTIVKYGGTSWDTGSTTLSTLSGTVATAPITWPTSPLTVTGTFEDRLFRFKTYDIAGRSSNEVQKSLRVEAPSAPTISTPIFEPIDNTIKLSWNTCKTTLPIDYYDVQLNGTSIQKVYALETILPVTWTTNANYGIKAYDINGNSGSIGYKSATATASTAVTFKTPAYNVIDSNCLVLWNAPASLGSFSLSHYNIYHTSVSTNNFIASSTTESLSIPINWTIGTSRTFIVIPVDSKGNTGPSASTVVSIALPTAPTIDVAGSTFIADQYIIKWDAVIPDISKLSIQEYEVGYYTNYGTTSQAEVSIARVKGTVYSSKANWADTRYFWVKSVDILGTLGNPTSGTGLTVNVPSSIPSEDLKADTVDNNVLLYWSMPASTLPVVTYEIREGSSWATPNRSIGEKTGSFTSVFEVTEGIYTYWIAAIDSAGNYGVPNSVTARVSQPPDYVLQSDRYVDFVSGANIVKTNAFADGTALVMPVNLTETWEGHFTSRNWTSPSDQIADGFDIFIEPGATDATFQETFDFGTTLTSTKITITPTKEIVSGAPTTKCDIYLSNISSTGPWTEYLDSWSTYGSNFQWLKYVITTTGAKSATYTQSTTTATIQCTAHGLIASDQVYLDFTTGGGANTYDNLYTVSSIVDADNFKVIGVPTGTASGAALVYSDKFSGIVRLDKLNIRLDAKLKSITGTVPIRPAVTSGATYSHAGYTLAVTKTAHGAVAGEIIELDYGLTGATYVQTDTSIVITKTAHGFLATEKVLLDFEVGSAGTPYDDYFTITSAAANTFTVISTQSIASTSGNVKSIGQPFKIQSVTADTISLINVVSKTASGSTNINKQGTCIFITSDRSPEGTREFVDVDAISVTPNSTTAIIQVYDFADKPYPWYLRILTFNTGGTAYTGTAFSCSYSIRGF